MTSQNGDGNPAEALCIDGTTVVLEVVLNGQYRALSRHDCALADPNPLGDLYFLFDQRFRGNFNTVTYYDFDENPPKPFKDLALQ
ncbi:hypothetical protein shim_04570 [Shimia sp. SK013]|uniref:hypothetical protein n=1 Tax=Shimia sp. SK013 TaxID=1389006 RepID=UPI0006B41E00|nr:hypothetical protein [Shimia sp. SK013]KPA23262.1 hypothetical protein shim_04570 [Shimia sp. SK013]